MQSKETAEKPLEAGNASHDFVPPQALVEFMSSGWIDQAAPREAHPQAERFRARRAALSQAYPGTYVVLPAGVERVRANDTSFRFRPSSDVAYLVGGGEPGGLLVLEPDGASHRSVLFVPAHNRGKAEFFTDRVYGELWVGRHRGVDESRAYYGVDECRPLQSLRPYLEELRGAAHPVRVLRGHDDTVDALFDLGGADDELAEHLSEMRLIKDDYELGELRRACAITKRGFEDVVRAMRNGVSERDVEAVFWRRARIEANDTGYLTIAAGCEHACTLHWTRNDGTLRSGELLLLDAGVECDSLYTADVTRTLPVSGRFTPEQRSVYEIVWAAQRAGIEAAVAGNDFLEPHRRAVRVMAEGLIELGILKVSLDEALDPERLFHRRYTLHGVSHMLGLDVHDCARAREREYRYATLREGMVLTVEPGLYFQPDDATVPERFRGIGVRIEDDVAITAAAADNLSGAIPSTADDVERWIAELRESASTASA